MAFNLYDMEVVSVIGEKYLQKLERKQVFETGSEKDFIRAKDIQKLIAEVRRSKSLEAEYNKSFNLLQQENQRYKQALKFYADENSYITHVAGMDIEPTVMMDKGYIATKALKGEE
jgi:hypothetical protein